jgi:hypothetical protein
MKPGRTQESVVGTSGRHTLERSIQPRLGFVVSHTLSLSLSTGHPYCAAAVLARLPYEVLLRHRPLHQNSARPISMFRYSHSGTESAIAAEPKILLAVRLYYYRRVKTE